MKINSIKFGMEHKKRDIEIRAKIPFRESPQKSDRKKSNRGKSDRGKSDREKSNRGLSRNKTFLENESTRKSAKVHDALTEFFLSA